MQLLIHQLDPNFEELLDLGEGTLLVLEVVLIVLQFADRHHITDHLARFAIVQGAYRSYRVDEGTARRPDGSTADLHQLTAEVIAELGLPVFVKPANMGSSVGVSRAASADEVVAAVELAASYDRLVIVEENIRGREIELSVLGDDDPEVSLPGEIVPGEEFYSYDDKYVTDGAQLLVPAPLDAATMSEVRELAVRTFRALRCEGLARVDFFLERDEAGHGRGLLCNEVNTMPGFTPISMFPKLWMESGMTYGGLIDRLVDLALDRHHRRRRNTKH